MSKVNHYYNLIYVMAKNFLKKSYKNPKFANFKGTNEFTFIVFITTIYLIINDPENTAIFKESSIMVLDNT